MSLEAHVRLLLPYAGAIEVPLMTTGTIGTTVLNPITAPAAATMPADFTMLPIVIIPPTSLDAAKAATNQMYGGELFTKFQIELNRIILRSDESNRHILNLRRLTPKCLDDK